VGLNDAGKVRKPLITIAVVFCFALICIHEQLHFLFAVYAVLAFIHVYCNTGYMQPCFSNCCKLPNTNIDHFRGTADNNTSSVSRFTYKTAVTVASSNVKTKSDLRAIVTNITFYSFDNGLFCNKSLTRI